MKALIWNSRWLLFVTVLGLAACSGGGDEPTPPVAGQMKTTVVRTFTFLADEQCEFGGVTIETGFDGNENGVLDANEVLNTYNVCHGSAGASGLNSLVIASVEPGGDQCVSGGVRIDSGLDHNQDGVLQSNEIENTRFVCNGQSAIASLIDIVPMGPGNACAFGGLQVLSGTDDNQNGHLDSSEVSQSQTICNGNAGLVSLILQSDEPAGNQCASGGTRIDSGIDSNNNNQLDVDEIDLTHYVCHGQTGSNALLSINVIQSGAVCAAGGLEISIGSDLDNDNHLDDNEILQVQTLCHGQAGYNSLISQTEEPPGDHCELGGIRFDSGLDINRNNLLDSNEIDDTEYVCYNETPNFKGLVFAQDFMTHGLPELYRATKDAALQQKIVPIYNYDDTIFSIKPSPDGRYVAFVVAGENFSRRLFVINVQSGKNLVQLSPETGYDTKVMDYKWSPNSDWIAYTAMLNSDDISIQMVRPDGSAHMVINDDFLTDRNVTQFDWSFNGQYLGYIVDSSVDEGYELFVKNLQAMSDAPSLISNIGDGTNANYDVKQFQWSPVENRLAYVADRHTDEQYHLYAISMGQFSSTYARLSGALVANGDVAYFNWSPTGEYVAYSADNLLDNNYQLFAVRSDGSEHRQVSANGSNHQTRISYPKWSYDGVFLAFLSDLNVVNRTELFVTRPQAQMASFSVYGVPSVDGYVQGFDWSPTSNHLAFYGNLIDSNVIDLFITQSTQWGQQENRVITRQSQPFQEVHFNHGYPFLWSPDGTHVAYIARENGSTRYNVFTSNITADDQRNQSWFFVDGTQAYNFKWSPDGQDLAIDYHGQNFTQLFTTPRNSNQRTRVSLDDGRARRVSLFDWIL